MIESNSRTLSRGSWRERLTADLPASFVVFLVALPLSMGIAIASGAPVTAGLVTGIVGGIVTGTLAGAPLQVSGPAAGLTVIVYQCVRDYGIEELGVVVLLAGMLQVLAGLMRLGQWFRAVSPAVVQGMLAGIGVLIFCSQFHVMVDDKPQPTGIANLLSIPESIAKAAPWPPGERDSAVERAARTDLLRQAGLLHLRQTEIAEEVHHLLTGIAGRSGETAPTQSPAEGEPAKASVTSSLEQSAAAGLRKLATVQESLIAELDREGIEKTAPLQLAAIAACRDALADLQSGSVQRARASQDRAADAIADWRDSLKSHRWAAALGILTILVLVGWHGTFGLRWKFLPAPLVAVSVSTIVAAWLDLPVLCVEVPNDLIEEIFLPSLAELKSLITPGLALISVQIAVIASAETLLCATAVDQLHEGPRTNYDRELIAQGVGNFICGALSALPMTGVIVRSSANIQAGGKSRWSTVLHGVWLLLFVAVLSSALRIIPTASLAAILVYTGYKLVNVKTIRTLLRYGRSEAAIYVGTMIAIVATDLLTGVLIGLGLSIVKLLYTFSRVRIRLRVNRRRNRARLSLRGAATFLRLPKVARALDKVPPGVVLHIDISRLTYIDHACLELLKDWQTQHERTGGRILLDWHALRTRFSTEPLERSPSTEPSPHAERDLPGKSRSQEPQATISDSGPRRQLTGSEPPRTEPAD